MKRFGILGLLAMLSLVICADSAEARLFDRLRGNRRGTSTQATTNAHVQAQVAPNAHNGMAAPAPTTHNGVQSTYNAPYNGNVPGDRSGVSSDAHGTSRANSGAEAKTGVNAGVDGSPINRGQRFFNRR